MVDGIHWVLFSLTQLTSVHYVLFHRDKVTITRHLSAAKCWLPWTIAASSHSASLWITSATSIVWHKPEIVRNLLSLCTSAVRNVKVLFFWGWKIYFQIETIFIRRHLIFFWAQEMLKYFLMIIQFNKLTKIVVKGLNLLKDMWPTLPL